MRKTKEKDTTDRKKKTYLKIVKQEIYAVDNAVTGYTGNSPSRIIVIQPERQA